MANAVIFQGGKRSLIEVALGENILNALRGAGFVLLSPCGGNGTCGKCKVTLKGAVSEMSADEAVFLTEEEKAAGIRLACKTKILGDIEVTLPEGAIETQTKFSSVSYAVDPLVKSERGEAGVSFYIDGVCIEKDAPTAKNFGLAVDIGTTTVAVYLLDLDAGRVIGNRGFRNPQAAYGADVISRIDKIIKDGAMLAEQQRLILGAITEAAEKLVLLGGGSLSDIRAAVFCGNTVMEHIAAGIDPTPIANAPFTAPTLFGEWLDAAGLGLPFAKGAKVYFSPCFASYVGGDIACGMIAAGLDKPQNNVLFIDIGTNGEIGLSTETGLHFCSAAAGPALEGAHIRCGMPGTMGAVGKVYIDGDMIRYETVGGKTAIGICGSGIIDAVAVMLEAGLLDETGAIYEEDEVDGFADYLGEDWDGNTVFLIDTAREIYLSGKDIREIQLAKAAIAAGIRTLIHKAGIEISEITEVVLAGGFGSHIDAKNACRIGLIPRELSGKVRSVGNVAGAGAVMYLLSREARASAQTIVKRSDYIELSCDGFFMDTYIDEMMFEE